MDALQQIFVIGIMMAALGAALWTLRRRGIITFHGPAGTRAARKLQLLERLQLTPQHALCLVRINHSTLLIGVAPSTCSVLSTTLDAAPTFEVQR